MGISQDTVNTLTKMGVSGVSSKRLPEQMPEQNENGLDISWCTRVKVGQKPRHMPAKAQAMPLDSMYRDPCIVAAVGDVAIRPT